MPMRPAAPDPRRRRSASAAEAAPLTLDEPQLTTSIVRSLCISDIQLIRAPAPPFKFMRQNRTSLGTWLSPTNHVTSSRRACDGVVRKQHFDPSLRLAPWPHILAAMLQNDRGFPSRRKNR